MHTITTKLAGISVLLFLLVPTGAQAYRYVDSSAFQVTPSIYLFTHTYTAGFLNEDVQTPIAASTDSTVSEFPQVKYTILGSAAELADAEINGLVLSAEAEIVDNQYRTLAGERDTFTLISLVTLKNPQTSPADIQLRMDALPFRYMKDGVEKTGSYMVEPSNPEGLSLIVGE